MVQKIQFMKESKNYQSSAKRIVLGEGEVVGHKHVLESLKAISFTENGETDSWNSIPSIDFLLEGTGVLTHDEHDRMVFESGNYVSYNQVEFNPFDQTISRVFD